MIHLINGGLSHRRINRAVGDLVLGWEANNERRGLQTRMSPRGMAKVYDRNF
jgi:hypothetical protein